MQDNASQRHDSSKGSSVTTDLGQADGASSGAQVMPRPFRARSVLTIALGHAVHDTFTGFLAPLLPLFITNFGLTNAQAGALAVFMQAPSIVQPVIGHLADRTDLRVMMMVGPALTAAMMSMLGTARLYWVLAALLLVTGFSSAGFHAIAPAVAGRLSGARLGRGMGLWMVGGELGRVLGPVVVVGVVRLLTLRRMPWLMIGGFVGSALLYNHLRNVPSSDTKVSGGAHLRIALHGKRRWLVPILTIVIVRAFTVAALNVYLPTFLVGEGAEFWLAGVSLSVFAAAGVAGALGGGSLSDRLGRKPVLVASMLLTSLLLAAFLLASNWMRLPILLILGFVALSINPVAMALVQETFSENRALANGLYSGFGFTGRAVAVLALGALGDAYGLRSAFWVAAVVPLLGILPIFMMPGRVRE